jgi:hypothetical protein
VFPASRPTLLTWGLPDVKGRDRQRGPEKNPVIPARLRARMTGLLLAAAGGAAWDWSRSAMEADQPSPAGVTGAPMATCTAARRRIRRLGRSTAQLPRRPTGTTKTPPVRG